MKRSFKNIFILTLTTQMLRITGLVFIAFMSGKIGSEGIGLYQLTFSVYFLACTLASSGLGTAVSRLVAESIGKSGRVSSSNVVIRSIVFSLITGIFVGLALFFGAVFVGQNILGDARSIISLKMLSVGLPFMAVTSCIRGYFFGIKKAAIPASQMLFEQSVQLVIIFSIINAFALKGLEYACFAIALSSTASEIISCGYGLIAYTTERRRSMLLIYNEIGINQKILSIAVPVAATSNLRSGLRTAENILIPTGLRKYGLTEAAALSKFGLFGMAMPVLLFPSSFLTAIATVILPEISEANVLAQKMRIQHLFSTVFRITTVLSLLFCGIFIAFSYDFGMFVYGSEAAGSMILLLAPLVPLMYLDFIVDAMLNGLNRQTMSLKINVFDYCIRIGLILLFIPKYGFISYVGILYLSTMLNAFLSIKCLLSASDSSINITEWILKPLLCITAATIVVKILFSSAVSVQFWLLHFIIKILITILLYFILMLVFKVVRESDLIMLKAFFRDHKKRSRESYLK